MANQGRLSMNVTTFGKLADELFSLKLSGHFESRRHSVGPLNFQLHTDKTCAGLGFSTPFFSQSDPNSLGEIFNVFVIHDPNGTLSEIKAFTNVSSALCHEKAKHSLNQQIVIKDNERKMIKVFDLINQSALFYITDLTKLPPWERFSPIKEFIHLLALSKSCLMLHAGSIIPKISGRKCAILVGPGGSGKSSMTAYSITQGMQTHGDDYVLIDLQHDRPICWAVYRTLKLHHSSPAELNADLLDPWEFDVLTSKTVFLAKEGCAILDSSEVTKIYGICLSLKNADSALRMQNNPYLYSAMSTIQQMPFWVDTSLKLIKHLHQSVPYEPLLIPEGKPGLNQALTLIASQTNVC